MRLLILIGASLTVSTVTSSLASVLATETPKTTRPRPVGTLSPPLVKCSDDGRVHTGGRCLPDARTTPPPATTAKSINEKGVKATYNNRSISEKGVRAGRNISENGVPATKKSISEQGVKRAPDGKSIDQKGVPPTRNIGKKGIK